MHVEIFQNSRAREIEEEFMAWRRRHPGGKLLNFRPAGTFMIHRSTCGHFEGGTTEKFANERKVCSESEADLRAWADLEGVEIVPCGSCMPGSD